MEKAGRRMRRLRVFAALIAATLLGCFAGGKPGIEKAALRETSQQDGEEHKGTRLPSIDKWISELNDEDVAVRRKAARVLGQIGSEQAIEALATALKHEDWRTRCDAAEALGRSASSRAVEYLIRAMNDKKKDVRIHVMVAMGKSHDNKVLLPFIETLKDEDKSFREFAADALSRMTDQKFGQDYEKWKQWYGSRQEIIDLLRSEKGRRSISSRKGASRQATIPLLVGLLLSDDEEVRAATLDALKEITRQDFGEDYYKWKDWHRNQELASEVKDIPDPQSMQPKPDPESVRRQKEKTACEGKFRKLCRDLYHKLMLEAYSAYSDKEAWKLVRRVGIHRAREIMQKPIEAINEAFFFPSTYSKFGTGKSRPPRDVLVRIGKPAVGPLVGLLNDGNSLVRFTAAELLGKIGDKRAVQPLIEVLKDNEKSVRNAATGALKKLTAQDFGTDYDKWKAWSEKNKDK